MIRLACLLGLLSLSTIFPLVARLSGATAIWFVFVGTPALALAALLFGIAAWRAGGFHHRGAPPVGPGQRGRGRTEMPISRMSALAGLLLASASSARADGGAVFRARCAGCHGEHGTSDTAISATMKVPALSGDAKLAGMTDAQVTAAVKGNEKHPPTIKSMGDAELGEASAYAKTLATTK